MTSGPKALPTEEAASGGKFRWNVPRTLAVIAGILVLAGAVWGVYGRVLHAPFIFDDDATILKNPSIWRLWPLMGSGEEDGPLRPTKNRPTSARPLVNLSLAINYAIGGDNPAGYRAVNFAIHALSAVLLWAIVWRTLLLDYFGGAVARVAGVLAFLTALVWVVHPLNTESVAYVTQRTESMMGFFYLATLYASLRYWGAKSSGVRALWLVLATVAGACGMLSKEMMASAIAMVLLYERTFVTGSFRGALCASWPLYLGLALGWIPVFVINAGGPKTPLAGFHLGVPAYVWWLTQAKVLLLYLKLAIWPWPLVIHYEVPYLRTLAEAWPWALAVLVLIVATLALVWRRRAEGIVAAWVLAVLSPTLLIPLPGETVAERRMYVPLMALVPLAVVVGFAAVRWLVRRFSPSEQNRNGWPALALTSTGAVALAAVFSLVSVRRLAAYRSELAIWEDAAIHQPLDALVQVNLGTSLAKVGRADEAMEHFKRALVLDPENARAHFNLGDALAAKGQIEEALPHFEAAVRIEPDDAEAQFNLGQARFVIADQMLAVSFGARGKEEMNQAIEHFEAAVRMQPRYAAARHSLGVALARTERIAESIQHFEQAVKLEPDAEGYVNLLGAYAMANRPADAIGAWEKAIELVQKEGKIELATELKKNLAGYRAATGQP